MKSLEDPADLRLEVSPRRISQTQDEGATSGNGGALDVPDAPEVGPEQYLHILLNRVLAPRRRLFLLVEMF